MIRYRIFARVELFEVLPLTTSRHLASRAVTTPRRHGGDAARALTLGARRRTALRRPQGRRGASSPWSRWFRLHTLS